MTRPERIDGADLSHWQDGTLNFDAAQRAGVRWVVHKATGGTDYIDPNYVKRRRQAKRAGLPFGGYHFARPAAGDAKAEARWFISHASPAPGDLRPVLDLEKTGRLTMAAVAQWADAFCREVEALTGVVPICYTPYRLSADLESKSLMWRPRYNSANTPPDLPWDIWQFSNGVYGVPNQVAGLGHVDLNTMRKGLTMNDLLIAGRAKRPAPQGRFIVWNERVSNPPARVRKAVDYFIDRYNPVLIGLDEATPARGHLDGLGMTVFQHRRKSYGHMAETANTALLVRDDVKAHAHDVRLTKVWRGPVHGWEHDPRVWRWTVVDPNGQIDTAALVVHFPFGAAQQREAVDAVVDWFAHVKPGRAAVAMGDFNMGKDKLVRELHAAGLTGFKVAGSGIDLIVFRNATVKAKRLGKHVSDHHAMCYDVTPERSGGSRGKNIDVAIRRLQKARRVARKHGHKGRARRIGAALKILRAFKVH